MSSSEIISDNFSCPILDLLNFKISPRNPQDYGYNDSGVNSCIPSESVYYASEYLQLQNEVDLWKNKAKKFKLENIDLKLKTVEQHEKEVKLTSEKAEVYNNFKIKLDKEKGKNLKLSKALKRGRLQNKKNKDLCKKYKQEIKKLSNEVNELKIEKLESQEIFQKEQSNLSETLKTVHDFCEKCNQRSNVCTVCSNQACGNEMNALDSTSYLERFDDGDRIPAKKNLVAKNANSTEGYKSVSFANTSQRFNESVQLNQMTFPNGKRDSGYNLNCRRSHNRAINNATNSSQEVQTSSASASSSVDSGNRYIYSSTSSPNTPAELLNFDIDDLFEEN